MSSDKSLVLNFPQFPNFKVFIHKFTNVSNAATIKEHLLKGDEAYDFAFINSETILSIEQLTASIYRTLLDFTDFKIRTKTLHSEVIFSLSPTQNIMDALKRFGIQDESKNLVVVRVAQNEEREKYDLSVIEGDEVEVTEDSFKETVDIKLVQKNYKLNNDDRTQLIRQIVGAIQLRGH